MKQRIWLRKEAVSGGISGPIRDWKVEGGESFLTLIVVIRQLLNLDSRFSNHTTHPGPKVILTPGGIIFYDV
jgi:hypothetical protein